MLSISRIERQFEAREHQRLLRSVLNNGLPLPLPLSRRLEQSAAASVAIALRRVIELTHGPTPLSQAMLASLLNGQRPDGAFGPMPDDGPPDPLATAAAAAALAMALRDLPAAASQVQPCVASAAPGRLTGRPAATDDLHHADRGHARGPVEAGLDADRGSLAQRTARAHDRALAALARLQRDDGLFTGQPSDSDADRALVAALILRLLAGESAFRQRVRFAALCDWFDARRHLIEPAAAALYRAACAPQSTTAPRPPAIAA